MHVSLNDKEIVCHCPSTGSIANITFNKKVPCLLSPAATSARKTPFTVEAVYCKKIKEWIGINQNAINRYIEHFLRKRALKKIISSTDPLFREQTIGKSRLDFKIGNTYIEVKMPLQFLPGISNVEDLSNHGDPKIMQNRFTRHLRELKKRLRTNENAILLICFIYNAPIFFVPPSYRTKQSDRMRKLVAASVNAGVEIWQINLKITPRGITLINYFNISTLFS